MTSFYGIQIPSSIELPDDTKIEPYYTDKLLALAILKKVKPARMKVFSTSEEAEKFHEALEISPTQQASVEQNSPKANTGIASESLPYKSVPTRDLSQFRLAIERGDGEYVMNHIAQNPRYLISAGDTPTVLNEQFRYNALHSCSMKGQVGMAELLLNILSSDELYSSVYPSDYENMRAERRNHLIDLYLNTPDKGANETALHFASKFGHVNLVELYVNEPLVQIDVKNGRGQTPYDVAATRSGTAAEKRKIQQLLKGQYYVALYRSEDDDVTPVISEPWSPVMNQHDNVFDDPLNNSDRQSVTSPLRAAHRLTLPRAFGLSPQPDSNLVVKACAGPMSKEQAGDFKKCWSSPGTPRVTKLKSESKKLLSDVSRRDPYKGLEVKGRTLADQNNVQWNEFWSFLKCSVDLKTDTGLEKLEMYFSALEESTSHPYTASPVDSVITETPAGPSGDVSTNLNTTPDLNTTDDQLANLMSRLVLQSPNSPYLKSREDNTQQNTNITRMHSSNSSMSTSTTGEYNSKPLSSTPSKTNSSNNSANGDVSFETPSKDRGGNPSRGTPHRSYIELVVPSFALVFDRIRRLWPFGSLTRSPKPLLNDSFSDTNSPDSTPVFTKSTSQTGDQVLITPIKQKSSTVFIEGRTTPSKLDNDVLQALRTADINKEKYPSLYRWLNRVNQYSTQQQNRWPTPQRSTSHRRVLASASSPQLSTPSADNSFRRRVSAPQFELD